MGFWSGLVDDAQKKINPAHVIAIALTVASIFWVTYLVIKNSAMPDLTGVAYLLGGAGAMNVAHKAEDIINKFKKKPTEEIEQPVDPAPEQPTLVLKKKE